MPDDYTPTTETVRTRYQVGAMNYIGCGAEFDRWLAAHDAETRRAALDEAAAIARTYDDGYGMTAVLVAEAIEGERVAANG